MNISQAVEYGRSILADLDDAKVDVDSLLCYALQCQKKDIHMWSEMDLTESQQNKFQQLIQQRYTGQPTAYLIGSRGFWTLDLKVTLDTLIPRPDTELLVTLALDKIEANMLVADLGTGTGAVALSIAQERSATEIFAMDLSLSALQVAQQNAIDNNLDNVSFWQGSWLTALADNSINVVVSNPPYIETKDPHLLQGDVRFEPRLALVSGQDGLDDIRQIVKQAKYCLKPSGWLLVEHGYDQAERVQQLFIDAGFSNVSSEQDFGDNDRVVMGQK